MIFYPKKIDKIPAFFSTFSYECKIEKSEQFWTIESSIIYCTHTYTSSLFDMYVGIFLKRIHVDILVLNLHNFLSWENSKMSAEKCNIITKLFWSPALIHVTFTFMKIRHSSVWGRPSILFHQKIVGGWGPLIKTTLLCKISLN